MEPQIHVIPKEKHAATWFTKDGNHWDPNLMIMINGSFANLVAVQPLANNHTRLHTARGFRDIRNDFPVTLYTTTTNEGNA